MLLGLELFLCVPYCFPVSCKLLLDTTWQGKQGPSGKTKQHVHSIDLQERVNHTDKVDTGCHSFYASAPGFSLANSFFSSKSVLCYSLIGVPMLFIYSQLSPITRCLPVSGSHSPALHWVVDAHNRLFSAQLPKVSRVHPWNCNSFW